jgi:hypothetical protein
MGNNTLSFLGGSETHLLTLARELKKQGHEVNCYSPLLGEISQQLEKLGIKCSSSVTSFEPDLILAAHHQIVGKLKDWYQKPTVQTVHGIIHYFPGTQTKAPEHPGKADKFVAVSEEVQDKLKNDYGIESVVIRNFFEIEDLPIHAEPRQILFNSNYETKDGEVFNTVKDVAEHYKAKLVAIGHNFNQVANVEDYIKESDIVIGMGRSVLEGCAKGRLGIVHGRWGTGGVICEDNIKNLQHYNFSGRNNQGKFYTIQEMIIEIDKHYNPHDLDWQMVYMKNQHDVKIAADKYLMVGYDKSLL